MILNLFDQFASPTVLGFPLIFIAILTPWLILPRPSNKLIKNRHLTLLTWVIKMFAKQIFLPLNLKAQKWALTMASLMLFLLLMNLLGLLPYTFTPTTQLSLNLSLAIPFWLATILTGLRSQPTSSIAHLLPEGSPTMLIPTMVSIETISLVIRPLALAVRLTANLTAGHLLIQLTSMAILALLSLPLAASITLIALLLLTILEIAVAIIQAYVFVLLLSLYLQENT